MYNNYNAYNYGAGAVAGLTAASTIMIIYLSIILASIAVYVVTVIGLWKVFIKAGRHGWEAIIPFYNTWTLFEISGYNGAYMFFGFIPYAGIVILLVFQIKAAISLSRKFHKNGGFAALLVLVPVVGYCILGFGNDKYDGNLGTQKVQPVTTETRDGKEEPFKYCEYCGAKLFSDYKHCPKCGKKLKK